MSCDHCGLTWPYPLMLDVECPDCHAKPGSWCVRPSGHRASDIHYARDEAALDAGALTICPEPYSRQHHRITLESARTSGGFKDVAEVPSPPNAAADPRPSRLSKKEWARVKANEAHPPEVVAHAPSWMVGAFGMENLVKEGLVVEEPSPGVTSVLVGKQVVPVPAKRPAVTLDSFA